MPPSPAPALRDQDDRFRLAIQAASGMAIVDLDGRWHDVNPALEQLLGYRADEMLGRSVAALIHPDDAALAAGITATLAADGDHSCRVRLRFVHRDGSQVLADVVASLAVDAQDQARFLLLQVVDVTADAERQAANTRRNDELEALQRQLQRFSDAVAHDLRAPLRSIESFSGLLAKRAADSLDDTGRDYLQRIRAAANNMSGLLVALGELSNATRAGMKPSQVDLGLLAEWVGAELQEAAPERRAEIVVQPGLLCWGDQRLLKQLLDQLLGNAWKFSRDCAITRIEVSGQREGAILRVNVRDAGIGFDTRYSQKLFEPFQRLHGSGQGGGHGLGLAIAQRIAERHGGRISGDSRPEGGATFTVELPADQAPEDRPDA